MSSNERPAIEVTNLSKSYKISHQLAKNSHPTVKDAFVKTAKKPLAWMGAYHGVDREEFWALKDLNFEVAKGDVLGVMGRNGSGKSTLFKILSRITQPTTGEAVLRGKVASLLEVGTGFHPELTGRENVYFNGSILGMSKREIQRKFDDIVAFSEVERFLDTPTKFYSSGMKVRLAFSVAAHLEAEILLIDEVLAVGDVRFKQKSLERMQQVAKDGKTILFVSHIIHQIEKICNRGIVLDSGNKVFDGGLEDAINTYLDLNELSGSAASEARVDEDGGGPAPVSNGLGFTITKTDVSFGKSGLPQLAIEATIKNLHGKDHDDIWAYFILASKINRNLGIIDNRMIDKPLPLKANQDEIRIKATIKNLNLIPDDYLITAGIRSTVDPDTVYFRQDQAAKFNVPDYLFNDIDLKKYKRWLPPMVFDYDVDG